MKFQETYKITLALLATLLAVIGTTATAVQADGPPNEAGDTPGDLLSLANVGKFYALPKGIQDLLEDEFLPLLVAQGFSRDDKAAYFTEVVGLEYQARVIDVPEDGGDDAVTGASGNLPGGDCTLAGPHFYAGSLTVSSYSSVSCDYTQASITISGELLHRASDTYETNTRVRHRVTSNFIAVFLPRQTGLWNTCGEFATTPQTGRDMADTPHDKVCIIEIPVN